MIASHSEVPHGGWWRGSHRPRWRAGGLVESALAAIRDWRQRRRARRQIAALDARVSHDIAICRCDPLDRNREQKERNAWLDTLGLPPF